MIGAATGSKGCRRISLSGANDTTVAGRFMARGHEGIKGEELGETDAASPKL